MEAAERIEPLYNLNRRSLLDELSAEYGAGYASILGNMMGILRRTEGSKTAQAKSLRCKADGLRFGLVLLQRAGHVDSEDAAEAVVKEHISHYRTAYLEDEELDRRHG